MYQELAEHNLVPGLRDSPQQFRSTAFKRWEDRASVRRKPHRHLPGGHEGIYFSPELHPISQHPLVLAHGPTAPNYLLIRRLYDYLHFTTELETLAVIPVATSISRGRSGLPVSAGMKADAFKIVTDEAWHAQFSNDLAQEASEATGVHLPPWDTAPTFLRRLDNVRRDMPDALLGVESLLFSIVSETLISGILSDLPRDVRLPSAVRDMVRAHAEDEGRHHAYFRTVLRALWEVLTQEERRTVTPLIPRIVYAFLEPDYAEATLAMADMGMSASNIEQVPCETWPQAAVATTVAEGAKPIIRYLAEFDAFDDEKTKEAFIVSGLLTPE